jgi:hypothetical protein
LVKMNSVSRNNASYFMMLWVTHRKLTNKKTMSKRTQAKVLTWGEMFTCAWPMPSDNFGNEVNLPNPWTKKANFP